MGTTERGGAYDNGTFFILHPPATPGGAWTETVDVRFGDPARRMAGRFRSARR